MSSISLTVPATARTFVSAKTAHAVPLASGLVERALIQASLDPDVLAIAPVRPPQWSADADPRSHFVLTHADERVAVHVAIEDSAPDIEPVPGGIATVVIRPADLATEPFASNATLAWACSRRWYSPGDQVRVLRFLKEHGDGTLIEVAQCASVSSDPIATVIAMACRDLVEIDLRSGPLGPDTRVALRLAP